MTGTWPACSAVGVGAAQVLVTGSRTHRGSVELFYHYCKMLYYFLHIPYYHYVQCDATHVRSKAPHVWDCHMYTR